MTPWMPFIQDALDDPNVWKVVCMKPAQVAWTTLLLNFLGKTIHTAPRPIIGMFAKTEAAKEFREEKLVPMIRACRPLARLVDVFSSRKQGQRWNFLPYPGGFLKLVGSNSPTNVKSTPAPYVFVEEPDDASSNVGKQGNSIKMLEERTKTYDERKVIFGGTPSVKGLSVIEDAYDVSDQREFEVPCHDCGEYHVLAWGNVSWIDKDSGQPHPVYGMSQPETAVYVCPHCGSAWNDRQKRRNVSKLRPVARKEFNGIAGFKFNELYASWKSSSLQRLTERYLEAKYNLERGDDTDMIVFVNSALGEPYEFEGERLNADTLREAAEHDPNSQYAELFVPAGGLVLTCGTDVQHDRLSILIRAWGRDEESWLTYWIEIYGNTADKTDKVWDGLEKILLQPILHESGAYLRVSAFTLDTSDGGTSDAAYSFIRRIQGKIRWAMAGKGYSQDYGSREVFSKPSTSIDTKGQGNTKASKYGLRVYMIGTHRAKDLLHQRLKLSGTGAGRMHVYKNVRTDYWNQITGEVKAPHRSIRGKRIWQKKSGAQVEALDGEVYAIHAARAAKVHLMREHDWLEIERTLHQNDFFKEEASANSQGATDDSLHGFMADIAKKLSN